MFIAVCAVFIGITMLVTSKMCNVVILKCELCVHDRNKQCSAFRNLEV
jgi:hypothetical protein